MSAKKPKCPVVFEVKTYFGAAEIHGPGLLNPIVLKVPPTADRWHMDIEREQIRENQKETFQLAEIQRKRLQNIFEAGFNCAFNLGRRRRKGARSE